MTDNGAETVMSALEGRIVSDADGLKGVCRMDTISLRRHGSGEDC